MPLAVVAGLARGGEQISLMSTSFGHGGVQGLRLGLTAGRGRG